jgi:hypothetical protein
LTEVFPPSKLARTFSSGVAELVVPKPMTTVG